MNVEFISGVRISSANRLLSRTATVQLRHNEIRDLTADLLTEVCSDVHIEPDLQPVEGELLTGLSANVQDGARLDIAANGFW